MRASNVILAAAIVAAAGTLHTRLWAEPRPAAQAPASSVFDGVYSEAQATRGELAYLRYCANCHGAALDGGDMTPGLTGAVFKANWNDLTLGDLFERIRISMPLDRPGRLTRQQNADVIAYILKTGQWPAGARDMPTDLPALRQIKVESVQR